MNNLEIAKNLLKKMTIEEKILQLSCMTPGPLSKNAEVDTKKLKEYIPNGIGRMTQFSTSFLSDAKTVASAYNEIQKYHIENTRLGIPFMPQNESITGLVFGNATIFPSSIALASTWNEEYARDVGVITSKEAKSVGIRQLLSPVADITRDARWSRIEETFGEDVNLVSSFTNKYVEGIQQKNYSDNVIATGKHFLGFGTTERGLSASVVPYGEREILETYSAPFHRAIKEQNLQSVMVTFSPVEGLPMTVNNYYLRNILRNKLGFDGLVLCDGRSTTRALYGSKIAKDEKEMAVLALKAGTQADTPVTSDQCYFHLIEAVKEDATLEKFIDEAVLKHLEQKFELGLFDNPYVDINKIDEVVRDNNSLMKVEEITNKSLVLLKNDGVLPLKNPKRIGLVTDAAYKILPLLGAYSFPHFAEMFIDICRGANVHMDGMNSAFRSIDKENLKKVFDIDENLTIDDNLEKYLKKNYKTSSLYDALVHEFPDSEIVVVDTNDINKIRNKETELKKCDAIIVVSHEDYSFLKKITTSGEASANNDIELVKEQKDMIEEVSTYGIPMIYAIFNGRPQNITFENNISSAVVELWHPGEFGATSFARVISGAVNPSGKLPITIPKHSGQCPIYYSHPHASGFRSSDFNCENNGVDEILAPLYHFGHGLSYTKFKIDVGDLNSSYNIGDKIEIAVKIKNTGEYTGDEVIQIYSQSTKTSIVRPVIELRGFKRVSLDVNETKKLKFIFDTKQFAYFDFEKNLIIEPHDLRLFVGTSSVDLIKEIDIKLTGNKTVLEMSERVFEPKIIE